MDDHEDEALHAAFQAVLTARPEPPLPSLTDEAIAGGRRIRRRRVALAATGVVAVSAVVAFGLSWTGVERAPLPPTPADTVPPTPPEPEGEDVEVPVPVEPPDGPPHAEPNPAGAELSRDAGLSPPARLHLPQPAEQREQR